MWWVIQASLCTVEIIEKGPGSLNDDLALRMLLKGFEKSSNIAMGDVENLVHLKTKLEKDVVLQLQHLFSHVFVFD